MPPESLKRPSNREYEKLRGYAGLGSKGNSHSDADRRSDGQVDTDRILYSSAFRRLSGVTQITSPDGTAIVHDRLLHSLKVGQVAKSIAARFESCDVDIDPDICYAASLAHDLGHPPFGHAGERELQRILSGEIPSDGGIVRGEVGPPTNLDGFEGNAQSFRIIGKISARKRDEWDTRLGMRLCYRTLAATAKYPWTKGHHPDDKPYLAAKWGAYSTEAGLLEDAIQCAKHDNIWLGERSVEAQIMDYADDIAYALGDVEDYYRVGVVDFSALMETQESPGRSRMEGLEERLANPSGFPRLAPRDTFGEFYGYARSRILEWADKIRDPDLDQSKTIELLQSAIQVLSSQGALPVAPYDGGSTGKIFVRSYVSRLISRYIDACEVTENGLFVPMAIQVEIEVLKKLTRFFTWDRPTIRLLQAGQVKALRRCFFAFYDVCCGYFVRSPLRDTHFAIPARLYEYCLVALEDGSRSTPPPTFEAMIARAVCDYLCTLTDRSVLAIATALREGEGKILTNLSSL